MNLADSEGYAPLSNAMWAGSAEAVAMLSQDARVDPDTVSAHGSTALHIAAEKCRPQMAAGLLSRKDVDVNAAAEQAALKQRAKILVYRYK